MTTKKRLRKRDVQEKMKWCASTLNKRIADGQAYIIDGERRYRASKMAKVKTIPTIEREYFEIKTKKEIIDCAEPIMDARRDNWRGTDSKKPVRELIELILDFDYVYGVPADLVEMYADVES